jgi:hypothetical protein
MHRPLPDIPQRDYSEAVARAIAWLGDRYLLARPIKVGARRFALRRADEDVGAATDASRHGVISG